MPDLLLVYASTHGHTVKLAARIAQVIEGRGVAAHVHDAGAGSAPPPSGYDAVMVGASVHGGRHQPEIVDWVKRHRRSLNGMPSAFFSVSLTAADDTEESRRATREYVDEFLDDTGWIPRETVSFGGALQYREYDFMTRLVMRVLMRRAGHTTDIWHDHEYTDWDAVERFARDCAAMAVEG
jgi:menaquinone-dependent protoporphyrinogen oxidase